MKQNNLQAKVVNHFKLGSYGTIYEIRHKTTQLTRAMKVIPKYMVKEKQNKLFNEVEILKNLDHPNIMSIYEVYADDENYYIIMEYLSGGDILKKIQSCTQISEKQLAYYFKQILSALTYCHSKGVVHRDIKGENILFVSENDNQIKLIDFGTSKKLLGKKYSKIIGSLYYMAPESIKGEYDQKCDIWACGVLLFIMLTGQPPFSGTNLENEILNGKPDFYKLKGVSSSAKSIIEKMLEKNPQKRISSYEALQDSWIQNNNIETPLGIESLQNLAQFYGLSKIRNAIMLFIATQIMNNKEKEELIQAFKSIDKNGDGLLSKQEMIEGYQKLYDQEKAEFLVQQIFDKVDLNQSGFVDFSEFIVAATQSIQMLNEQKLQQTFQLFDAVNSFYIKDGDGFLSRNELQHILGGLQLDDKVWQQFLQECDENNDGEISQSEFISMLSKQNFLLPMD